MLRNLFSNKKLLSPKVAKDNIEKDRSIVLLDVREMDEYKGGHIKGALLVPLGSIQDKMNKLNVLKSTTIYVYCHSGARSTRACDILEKMGYTQVYNLGGIISWPYEITK